MDNYFEPTETFDYAQKFKRAQGEWLKQNPGLTAQEFNELPEPDQWGLPPEGTPLDILPTPYNRHDWWKFKMLEWAGKEVSHMLIYNMPNDWERINSENLEFVPSYQSYLDMCHAFDEELKRAREADMKRRQRGLRFGPNIQGYINYSKLNPRSDGSVYHYIKTHIMYDVMLRDGEKFSQNELHSFPGAFMEILIKEVDYWLDIKNKYIVERFEQDLWR